jgi:hypothetical protein
MLRFQRDLKTVDSDSRKNSRIEFHHPVVILGVDTMARILDFSLGGFYVETAQLAKIKNGQRLSLALKLPEEKAFMALKAQVVHRDAKGFGCQLLGQSHEEAQALKKCFEVFSGMLPID